jgi:hypothetical protein
MPPSLGVALGLALRGVVREAWLVAVGLAVGVLRRLLVLAAAVYAWAFLLKAAILAVGARPLDPFAPLAAVLAAATSPRFLLVALGLWAAGVLAGAVLRVAFLSGAAPVLAAAMAGAPSGSGGFVAGVAYGAPRVIGAALLGLIAELGGGLFAVALVVGAVRVAGAQASPLLAAPVALALTLALAVPLALSAGVDAAVARAAVTGEGPLQAFAAATRRFLRRPGAFLLGALGAGLAGATIPAAVEAMGDAIAGLAPRAPPSVLLGPTLMMATLALAVAAAVDLAWLGTVSVLACGEERRANS